MEASYAQTQPPASSRTPEDPKLVKKKRLEVVMPTLSASEREKYVPPPKRKEQVRFEIPASAALEGENPPSAPREDISRPVHRPFDNVKAIDRPPIPKGPIVGNQHSEKEVNKGQSGDKEVSQADNRHAIVYTKPPRKAEPDFKIRNSLFKPGRVEEIADKILQAGLDISSGDLIAISPNLQKIMQRKLKNSRVYKKPIRTMVQEIRDEDSPDNENLPEEEDVHLPDAAYMVDIDDLAYDKEDVFMVLEEDSGSLKKGSCVHVDIVDQYQQDVPPADRDKVIIVARQTDNLKAIFPVINNGPPKYETDVDSGSQIVSMNTKVAINLGLSWDPETVIHMQSASGQLQPTRGLARNVPFKFGEITIYMQVHVIDRVPYDVLLGRPFDVLTNSTIQNFETGEQEITITDPNSGMKCTMGTYDRVQGPKRRDPGPPRLVPESQSASKAARLEESPKAEESQNFQMTSMN